VKKTTYNRNALMALILGRIEHKGSPQGLNVMAEELRWMGIRSITCEQLRSVAHSDLRSPHPQLRLVAEDVFWFAERNLPLGWSLYGDVRMLPCFYRVYPPRISWDELDRPENILPHSECPLDAAIGTIAGGRKLYP
jgi:hypothetical protein